MQREPGRFLSRFWRRISFGCVIGVGLYVLAGRSLPVMGQEDFPQKLVNFVSYKGTPIFQGRGPGYWDAKIRERGWILREGGVYHLWFTGYTPPESNIKRLGYATSKDGLHWTRYPENPLDSQHWIEDMMVVKVKGVYYMFAEGRNDHAQLLTSTDRIHWTRQGPLDIRTTQGSSLSPGPYGTPTAWYESGNWYLFYERNDVGVWLARSEDLKVWTHVQDDPVLQPGPGAYDRDLIALNQIIKYHGRYYAYYHGTNTSNHPFQWTTNVAVSSDLIHWTKYSGNPILDANKSSGILVNDGRRFRLYTMHNQVQVHFPRKP